MKYIDIHAHINIEEFHDREDLIAKKTADDDVAVINVGTGLENSKKAVALAQTYTHMRAIIGLHPIYAAPSYATEVGEDFDPHIYQEILNKNKELIVGVGECGFDYFHSSADAKELQEKAFRAQIEFAGKNNLPLMLHIRPSQDSFDAYQDSLELIKEYQLIYPDLTGDVHFFAGSVEIAEEFLDLGFYISFTGVITFARMYEKLVKAVPIDRIFAETDSPYVAPVPFRGQRNEPSHVREVYRKIAKIKEVDEEVLRNQIRQNVKHLFGFSF